MEMTPLLPEELVEMLQGSLVGGFDVKKTARVAFDIYRLHGRRLTPEMDDILLMLMAMEEGPEFELRESEFLDVIEDVRTM